MSAEATFAAELDYLKAKAAIDLLAKVEELRILRVGNTRLGDELDGANDKISEEVERADDAEDHAEYWRDTSNELQRRIEGEQNITRARTKELDALKAELESLQTISADSKNLLTEKLALSRERETLKTELEHLRSQVASNESLLAEKLSLRRELTTCQAELEESKRSLQRLQEKYDQRREQDARRESEIQQVKQDLAKEKREREKAQSAAEKGADDEQIGDLRKELAKEKREREKAEKAASKSNAENDEMTNLKKELAAEKRERAKVDKLAAKSSAEWEAQKAVLEDKLDQFRTKLRSTKETLKETQTALEEAEQRSTNGPSIAQPKNARKRSAAQMDPDAAIGTPGDAAANKRTKRGASVVGAKSTFSITPFLNRTTSVAPESPKDQAQNDPDEPLPSIEAIISPTAERGNKTGANKATPLAPSSPSKSNAKVRKPNGATRKKAAPSLTLEKVTEEGDINDPPQSMSVNPDEPSTGHNNENVPPAEINEDTSIAAKDSAATKPARLSLKPKKSLSSFATFREGSLPPQQLPKKKRKLLGGGPKTIFDEDEDGEGEGEVLGGLKAPVSLGGQRAFGAFGAKRALGMLGGAKKKGPLVVAKDGFMFSPLKKDRKAMAAAASAVAVGEA